MTQLHDRAVFPHLCSKMLPGYPTSRNVISRLLPGHLLPGPGFAKPSMDRANEGSVDSQCVCLFSDQERNLGPAHARFETSFTNV